jgi:hypothetical protein
VSIQNDEVAAAVAAIQELVKLESQTIASEMNALGLMRERIAPAARFGDWIQTRYRRFRYRTDREAEQWGYLPTGFPFSDSGGLLTALLVLDNFTTVETPVADAAARSGHYTGDRLYLMKEKKWILAERVGVYSEEEGSASQWDAQCRVIADRVLLERYSVEVITQALFSSATKIMEKVTPRLDTLKERASQAQEITGVLSKLGTGIKVVTPMPPPKEKEKRPDDLMGPRRTVPIQQRSVNS